jgi:hypothetical protein
LPCCAILACSKVGTWDENFVIQMNPWITNFLLLAIFSRKSRFGAREARQWTCPGFTSVVCAINWIHSLFNETCFQPQCNCQEEAFSKRKQKGTNLRRTFVGELWTLLLCIVGSSAEQKHSTRRQITK